MTRKSILSLALLVAASPAFASNAPAAPETTAGAAVAQVASPALPTMLFLSSIAEDELFDLIKATPAFAALDKEMVGSPLTLMVTHTVRPTAGGQAAGFISGILSGSTLGIIPVVTSNRLVVKYEVRLNGKPVTEYQFERTDTRAVNIWAAGNDKHAGLGKDGFDWLKSTAGEAAAKLAVDPALAAVRRDIEFYFAAPAPAATAAAP
jgi:hypothetical protein